MSEWLPPEGTAARQSAGLFRAAGRAGGDPGEGEDITLVSYGATLRIVQEAAAVLEGSGIACEIVDVQTLLPFDVHHKILDSLKKTSRIVFIDEDVPGGAAGYMFNKVMEEQGGYKWLDTAPRTLTAKAHRPAYASDGDYFQAECRRDHRYGEGDDEGVGGAAGPGCGRG